jgi:hypothetical protein
VAVGGRITAEHDGSLHAQVTGCIEMCYADGPSDEDDRPPYVLAASGLSIFREYLAVIQDDANWLALIDADQRVSAVPLPPGPNGDRVFTKSRGNQDYKCDLEACISVPGEHGLELIGFGSGSQAGREWILRVSETAGGGKDRETPDFTTDLFKAEPFFAMLRAQLDFCGSGLNLEGAVAIDDERIVLFQRGNAAPCGELQPIDATAELTWSELRAYLADPERNEPPQLKGVRSYELGQLDGVRLTFSDAEHLGGGRILYSASAEDRETGAIAGSVLGILEADGSARWTELIDGDGAPFKAKIEGLTRDLHDERMIHFVVDDDDDGVPSKVFQAMIGPEFLTAAQG